MRNCVQSACLALAAITSVMPAFGDTLANGATSSALELDDAFVTGINEATSFAFLPDGRMIVTERRGTLRVRTAAGALVSAGTLPVQLGTGEQGLLNALPHPDFAQNRLLFVYYTAGANATPPPAENQGNRLVQVELGSDNQLRLATERVLVDELWTNGNHNGGALAVYRDKLFLGVGDGTGPLRSSCLTSGNGKILRIGIDGRVPADNPLVGRSVTECDNDTATRSEIWSWGLRNPWRLWADPQTGNLWVGDVGDGAHEEIDVVPSTGAVHLGWPHREANVARQNTTVARCANDAPGGGNCLDPVHVCEHPTCQSITGGLILDACEWPPSLEGRYVFGDYEAGTVWTLGVNAARNAVVGDRVALAQGEGGGPVHFVEYDGALYVLMHAGAAHITRIAPRAPDTDCSGAGGSPSGGGSSTGGSSSGGRSAGGATNTAGDSAEAGAGGDEAGSSSGGAQSRGGSSSGGSAATGGSTASGGASEIGGASDSGGDLGVDSPQDNEGCGCHVGRRTRSMLLAAVAASCVAFLSRRWRRRAR